MDGVDLEFNSRN